MLLRTTSTRDSSGCLMIPLPLFHLNWRSTCNPTAGVHCLCASKPSIFVILFLFLIGSCSFPLRRESAWALINKPSGVRLLETWKQENMPRSESQRSYSYWRNWTAQVLPNSKTPSFPPDDIINDTNWMRVYFAKATPSTYTSVNIRLLSPEVTRYLPLAHIPLISTSVLQKVPDTFCRDFSVEAQRILSTAQFLALPGGCLAQLEARWALVRSEQLSGLSASQMSSAFLSDCNAAKSPFAVMKCEQLAALPFSILVSNSSGVPRGVKECFLSVRKACFKALSVFTHCFFAALCKMSRSASRYC